MAATKAHRPKTPPKRKQATRVLHKLTNSSVRSFLLSLAGTILMGAGSAMITGIHMASNFNADQAARQAKLDQLLTAHDERITRLEKDIVPRSEHESKDKLLTEELATLEKQMGELREDVRDLRSYMVGRAGNAGNGGR